MFIIASVIIIAFSVWAMLVPATAQSTMKTVVAWIAENLGWFYVLTVTVVIGFVLWVALSKEGSVRLGPDHSRPQYKLFTWVAMLFAAGVGIDMLFYSVTGPITQYMMPPVGEGQTPAAAQDAVVWTMFHYGIAGWAMYRSSAWPWGISPTAGACRCPSGRPCTRCWANASAAASATRSTSSPWWAPSSVWPRPWGSAWCC